MRYPSILRRYLATTIDGGIIAAVFLAVSYGLDQGSSVIGVLRLLIIFSVVFIYEPLCTSRFYTIGQKVTGIRVRKFQTLEHTSILAAYQRIIIKGMLGIFSLLVIVFNKDKRAIHDFAAGSVVIFEN